MEPEHASYLVYITDQEPTNELLPINTFAADKQCDPNNLTFVGCHGALIAPNKAIVNR